MYETLSMKHKLLTNSWAFNLDDVHFCAYWENAFTKEECIKIVKSIKKQSKLLTKGKTIGKEVADVRKSNIFWIGANEDTAWIYERLTSIITDLNNRYFKFDLYGIVEALQFTNYKAPGDKYGKHLDKSTNHLIRKLSVSVQLTDPKEYKGGELMLYPAEEPYLMKKEQGSLSLFPSYVLHEVTPVTKGERNSLVTWVTGKPFK